MTENDDIREGLGEGPEVTSVEMDAALERLTKRAESQRRRTQVIAGSAVAILLVLIGGFVVLEPTPISKHVDPAIRPSSTTYATTTTASTTTTLPSGLVISEDTPLTPEGLGVVRIGMTKKQLEKTTNIRLNQLDGDPESNCRMAIVDGAPVGVKAMLEDGVITRIEVSTYGEDGENASFPTKAKGVGVGSTEAQVKAAFPSVRVTPSEYLGDEGGHYMIYEPNGSKGNKIVFETANGLVSEFRAGSFPSVEYVEHCL